MTYEELDAKYNKLQDAADACDTAAVELEELAKVDTAVRAARRALKAAQRRYERRAEKVGKQMDKAAEEEA